MKPELLRRRFWRTCIFVVVLQAIGQANLRAADPALDFHFQNSLVDLGGGATLGFLSARPPEFVQDSVDGVETIAARFEAGEGFALSGAGRWLADGDYTVAVLFRFEQISSWKRILDFKNRTTDWGVYGYYGNLNFYPLVTGSGGSIAAGQYVQVAFARRSDGVVRGYVNGVLEITFEDTTSAAIPGVADTLSFFQDDLQVPNEASAGAVARIRVFDTALTSAQIEALDRLPGVLSHPPVITSPSNIHVLAGRPFSFQIGAAYSPTAFSGTGLPGWLTLDTKTGLLSGTPPDKGSHSFGVSAINAAGNTVQEMTLVAGDMVIQADAYPAITVMGFPGAVCVVEASPTLGEGAEWSERATVNLVDGQASFIDAPSGEARFFRAKLIPQ